MARKITKTFENTTTNVTYKVLEPCEDGIKRLSEHTITLAGSKSDKSARIELEKTLNTKNFMLVAVDAPTRSGDGFTYEMDAQTFINNSNVCEDGISYPREYVTATFKVDSVAYYTLDGTLRFVEIEHTTERKQRAAVAEMLGENVEFIIDPDATMVFDIRRYMTREDFMQIGHVVKK